MSEAYFPPPETADENDIVVCGGDLAPDRLLAAYRSGIFPWPILGDGYPVPWCSPDPRCIFELDRLHVSRRLARTIRSGRFQLTCDKDFAAVIAGCAEPRRDDGDSWITDEMKLAYSRMHQLGHVHSVEAWCGGRLAGGLYGVAVGALFAGESMFYRVRDASKVALVGLARHLVRRGYVLFDIQQLTEHTRRMGAIEISRSQYLRRLDKAIELPVTFGDHLQDESSICPARAR